MRREEWEEGRGKKKTSVGLSILAVLVYGSWRLSKDSLLCDVLA
jgi:hypothetical protein